MKLVSLVILLFSNSVLALSGVIDSKVLGSKSLEISYTAIQVVPTTIQSSVHAETDTQERFCNNSLVFPHIAQAIYTMDGITVQESQSVVVDLGTEILSEYQTCFAPAQLPAADYLVLNLDKSGYPQFIISEKVVNGEKEKLVLLVNLPRKLVTAEVVPVAEGLYTLENLKFGPRAVTAQFSVVKITMHAEGYPSWSYMEHGTVTLK